MNTTKKGGTNVITAKIVSQVARTERRENAINTLLVLEIAGPPLEDYCF